MPKGSFALVYCSSIHFADDIAIIADSEKDMNKMLNILSYALEEFKLKINKKKTKTMVAHGIVFVLDAADTGRLNECRDILMSILSNDKLSGKPLLVLGNKQDIPGALDEIDIVEMLDLEKLVNEQKCPTLLETCSAHMFQKPQKKEDLVIQNSFRTHSVKRVERHQYKGETFNADGLQDDVEPLIIRLTSNSCSSGNQSRQSGGKEGSLPGPSKMIQPTFEGIQELSDSDDD
ncbi:hypothetical protein J437_LFUL000751 [Ladona fulva]|uniref:Reverse transcriptase domain-containing protein n=1 Tax=Ladona fulva TaxID=123851 RepID=A0A8K0KP64_LADFU|nr:hypothetical protein J437_LFUL000751 [Ladona fulva]